MDWREICEPTKPRLILTTLLLIYTIFTLPVITMHATLCTEEGTDCFSAVYSVSIYYCLKIGFHEEFHSPSLYATRDCDKTDLVWLPLILITLYLMSYPLHTIYISNADSWKYGSKRGLLTFVSLIGTLLPALIFSILEAGSADLLKAYTTYPLGLFFVNAYLMNEGNFIIPVMTILVLFTITVILMNLFRKWEITPLLFYIIWMLYLVVAVLGGILLHLGPS